ncbi:short transient receptor potential channel 4-associated protein isoform X3 [Ixodes scapularis]|nr:short transient receptor potential channel 4-associated protein isoform X3 [Ixodes scapularis]
MHVGHPVGDLLPRRGPVPGGPGHPRGAAAEVAVQLARAVGPGAALSRPHRGIGAAGRRRDSAAHRDAVEPSAEGKCIKARGGSQVPGVAEPLRGATSSPDAAIARRLARSRELLDALLSLFQFTETCLVTCELVECLLLSRMAVLNLANLVNLSGLIVRLDDIQLANFCKILAISLSDLDVYEHKTSLYAQCKEKKRKDFTCVRDMNQEVILSVPGILERLVHIACAKPYTPRFPSAAGEMNHWMQWIERQVSACVQGRPSARPDFVGGISQWNRDTGRFQHEAALQISAEMTFRAEAVYILGLLLAGKRRREVQRALAALRLIPRLSDLFDHFVWKYNAGRGRMPGHNVNCECSPEVALKIQVLRLVHSFCEHAQYKHVMLSWSEYSELKRNEAARSVESPRLDRSLMCTGSKGLLTKIVEVLKKETGSSTFRFWLSRAIESYLRGCTSSADQDFLLSRGLLQLVAGSLVSLGVRQKEVLQSSFDLLGELVKFNVRAFRQLDKVLSTEAKQKKLLQLVNGYLVDSNMFVRSLVLSQEHLSSSSDKETRDYAERRSCVLSHIAEPRTRLRYLRKLVSLVNVSSLTQENVSCVNTALVLLMFAEQRGQLGDYLAALGAPSGGLLPNLLDLLHFWQDHYLHKDKDCSALEKSSRISFSRWKAMVHSLVSGGSLASPLHHPGPSTRDS